MMPQSSISYACGRIGVLKRGALRRSHMERLMAARTYDEARRTLSDIGFAATDSAEEAADRHVREACDLIKKVTPEPRVTDSFLLRYDTLNLKVLLKSRFLAQKPEFLSACGTLDAEKLRHAVADHTYADLPPMLEQAMNQLEKQLASHFDPMRIDTELDKAMFAQVFEWLKGAKCAVANEYFRAKADLQNLVMLLRVRAMRKDARLFAQLALPGGKISAEALARAFDEPEKLAKLVRGYGEAVYQAALEAALNASKLPHLEKAADDYLYRLFAPYRYHSGAFESILAYLLQCQREAADVRLILAGKLNGFSQEAVAERVRDLNG